MKVYKKISQPYNFKKLPLNCMTDKGKYVLTPQGVLHGGTLDTSLNSAGVLEFLVVELDEPVYLYKTALGWNTTAPAPFPYGRGVFYVKDGKLCYLRELKDEVEIEPLDEEYIYKVGAEGVMIATKRFKDNWRYALVIKDVKEFIREL